MARVTVKAPANIAFIKYWGAVDLARALPRHPSISMTLETCCSLSTVEWSAGEGPHEVWLADQEGNLSEASPAFRRRVVEHLDRLRLWAHKGGRFKVATRNSFPSAAGLASSASGFAALTLAATQAMGLELSQREQSILARRSGSGSATRSVMGGYVEWPAKDCDPTSDEECFAAPLAPQDHWDLADVIAIVETEAKEVSSLEGHRRAPSSPHFERRLLEIPQRLERTRRAIADKDFAALGEVIEEDSIDLHLIAMSSKPAIFYWKPATLAVLETVRQLRKSGCPAYATMDAGANVHVICPRAAEDTVASALVQTAGVTGTIRDRVGGGPEVQSEGLF